MTKLELERARVVYTEPANAGFVVLPHLPPNTIEHVRLEVESAAVQSFREVCDRIIQETEPIIHWKIAARRIQACEGISWRDAVGRVYRRRHNVCLAMRTFRELEPPKPTKPAHLTIRI